MLSHLSLKAKLLISYVILILTCLFIAPIRLSELHPFTTNKIQSKYNITKENFVLKNFTSYNCDQTWATFIVPFRNREQHLPLYVQAIETHQSNQNNSNYDILIIEQEDKGRFNRAKLLNIGAKIAMTQIEQKCTKEQSKQNLCLILHDIDMLPLNPKLKYECKKAPVLFATAAEQFGYKMPYRWYFGGVVAIHWKHFEIVNGYSNNYWGWGGEDDDFLARIQIQKLNWGRIHPKLGRFRSLSHEHDKNDEDPDAMAKNKFTRENPFALTTDGLNTVKYKLLTIQDYVRYTRITVDLLPDTSVYLELNDEFYQVPV